MPLFFLGTREWRNRQTRTVQVRVPVMEWGFNSPLAHDETADPSGSAVFVFPGCCLWPRWCSGRRRARLWGRAAPWAVARLIDGVACGPAGVPGAGGPGRCVCRWAAARPRAVRAASFARRVVSKPGQTPPPPTGTAADPSGALHTCGAWSRTCASALRLEARPGLATAHRHRSRALRSLRRPSHQWGLVADVLLGALLRSPARPCASKRSLSSVSHAIP